MEMLQHTAAISVILYCAGRFVLAVRADAINVKRYNLERERFLAEKKRLEVERELFKGRRHLTGFIQSEPPTYGISGFVARR